MSTPHRSWLRVALALVLAAILSVTLYPASGEPTHPLVWCIVCGEGGTADVILNIILFLPLGGVLALLGVPRNRAWIAGTLLSGMIECAQLGIPGRDSSLGDVLSNSTGTILGFILAGWVLLRLRPGVSTSRSGSLLPAALVVLVLGATGVLLRPSFPTGIDYYGQWTPDLGYLEWYRGRVVSAAIDSIALPSTRLEHTPDVRRRLLAGDRLLVRAVAGPPVPDLAPIFNVYDAAHHEITLLGVDQRDFVVRYRTRALEWGLDQPDLRLPGLARTLHPGDTLNIELWRDPAGGDGRLCARFNARQACGLGFTPGRGWAILIYPESFPEWLRVAIDVGWMAGLLFVVGFLSRGNRTALLLGGGLALAGLALLPRPLGLLPAPPLEWLGAAVGLLLGGAAWVVAARLVRLQGRDHPLYLTR